jgi:GntR family transcriptional regulator/MocR family aminotransferase
VSRWTLQLDPGGDPRPLTVRIAERLADDVRRGRLRPGDRLPGSRELAASLGVHRNTVLAAYQELVSEGWLVATNGSGTFVNRELPEVRPRSSKGVARAPGFDLPAWTPDPDAPAAPLVFGSTPDTRAVPWAPLARAWRRVTRRAAKALAGYVDPRGDEALRAALAQMLASTRGLAVGADDVQVTRGSQMAIYLAGRALLRPGDVVAVEGLGYRPAWTALRETGAELVPVPVDAEGLCVDALTELHRRRPVRAVYVTPHHQYPTTASMHPARRLALLALARAERFAVIEDDYDNEFHYEGWPLLPLAAADDAGVVVYVGTLSKILAPGLRIGFVVAPRPLLDRLAALRRHVDRQGDALGERAVAELFDEGEVQRHVRRVRREYERRRGVLAAALRERFGEDVRFDVPAGGLALWTRFAPDVDADAWAARCLARGVAFSPGSRFTFDGTPLPAARLGYATLTADELRRAVDVLAACA